MRHRDRADLVQPLLAELGDANRVAAARVEAASPQRLLRHIARLRIAQLHELIRHDAQDALAVVEVALRQREDVIDGLWGFVRVRLDLDRPLDRLDDEDGPRAG